MIEVQQAQGLRRVLLADAVVSGVTGVLLATGAGILADVLALPEPLLRYAGLFMVSYAMFVVAVAMRTLPWPTAVWTVIIGNGLWVLGSIALLLSGWVAPNMLGYGFVLGQALVVAFLAELQFLAQRRSRA